jgi:hypothetical protein
MPGSPFLFLLDFIFSFAFFFSLFPSPSPSHLLLLCYFSVSYDEERRRHEDANCDSGVVDDVQNTMHALVTIVKKEKLRGLFRGVVPTVVTNVWASP